MFTKTDGVGVSLLVWIMMRALGIWPSLAPEKNSLGAKKRLLA